MTSKRLTPREVYDVGVSAAENAIKVMQDATILMQADRPLRAYALAVIAVEEAAKHLTCRDLLFDWTGTITVAELNVALRPKGSAHIDRFAAVLYYLRGLNPWGSGPTIEEAPRVRREGHSAPRTCAIRRSGGRRESHDARWRGKRGILPTMGS